MTQACVTCVETVGIRAALWLQGGWAQVAMSEATGGASQRSRVWEEGT